jgi:hypothetical protein
MNKDIQYIMKAHIEQAKPYNAFNGRTKYFHPLWCAMTLLAETTVELDLRMNGATALLYHDILKNTTAELPLALKSEIMQLISEMTFQTYEEEIKEIWERSPQTRLLTLYDKTASLLDGSLRREDKAGYEAYTNRLCDETQGHFGDLNIIHIATSILPNNPRSDEVQLQYKQTTHNGGQWYEP